MLGERLYQGDKVESIYRENDVWLVCWGEYDRYSTDGTYLGEARGWFLENLKAGCLDLELNQDVADRLQLVVVAPVVLYAN